MRIAIVTHFPVVPTAPLGGVEAVSVNLVKGLVQLQDMEIHVVTLDTTIAANSISHWNNVTIHRLAVSSGSILLQACGTWKHTLQNYLINLRPDLVHSHDTYGIMTQGLRLPRVFTIHGFIYGDTLLSQKKLAWLRSRIWRAIETRAWAEQPHIISISPYVRERLNGIAKGVIYDIDNPVGEEFFHIQRAEKKGTIFSAAVISPRKNTLTLVKAFALIADEFPHATLRLAGKIINDDYARLIKEYILKRQLSDRVHFLGKIGTSQILDELAAASIFALVSLEENSPMGIEEAMAAGVPVVTSNKCGMPYMLQHGESGYLVNPMRQDEIAARFQTLLTDNNLRRSMGNISHNTASYKFHPTIVAKKTWQTYLEIF